MVFWAGVLLMPWSRARRRFWRVWARWWPIPAVLVVIVAAGVLLAW